MTGPSQTDTGTLIIGFVAVLTMNLCLTPCRSSSAVICSLPSHVPSLSISLPFCFSSLPHLSPSLCLANWLTILTQCYNCRLSTVLSLVFTGQKTQPTMWINCLPYNLYCVGGDVKHCSLTIHRTLSVSFKNVILEPVPCIVGLRLPSKAVCSLT